MNIGFSEVLMVGAYIAAIFYIFKHSYDKKLDATRKDIAELDQRLKAAENTLAGVKVSKAKKPEVKPVKNEEEMIAPSLVVSQRVETVPETKTAPAPVPVHVYKLEKDEEEVKPVVTSKTKTSANENMETKVAGKWFLWVGVIAFLFGLGYLFKYSIEQGWVSPLMRVLGGMANGLLFLGIGKYFYKKHKEFAQGMTGGGIAILYLSIFSGFQLYSLFDFYVAMILMVLVTLAGGFLSSHYNSKVIAVLSTLGGFLTPMLLYTGTDNQVTLFIYIALLDLGLLFLGYFKKWDMLKYLSFIGTVIIFLSWSSIHYSPEKLFTTGVFLSVFFTIFSLYALIQNILKNWKTSTPDLLFILINAFTYYLSFYLLFTNAAGPGLNYNTALAILALILAVFYGVQLYIGLRQQKEKGYINTVLLSLMIAFITVAIVVYFEQVWITIGWSVEALLLTWIGFKYKNKETRFVAGVVTMLVIVRLFGYDTPMNSSAYALIFNKRTLAFVFGLTAVFGNAWLYRKNKAAAEKDEAVLSILLGEIGILGIVWLSGIEIINYFDFTQNGLTHQVKDFYKYISFTALWSIAAGVVFFAGNALKAKAVKYSGLILLGLSMLLLVFLSAFPGEIYGMPVFNLRLLAFLPVTGLLFIISSVLRKENDPDSQNIAKLVLQAAIAVISFFTCIEIVNYYYLFPLTDGVDNYSMFSMLVLFWTLIAAVLGGLGFKLRSSMLRVNSLVLLTVCAAILLLALTNMPAKLYTLFINKRVLAYLPVIGTLFMMSYAYSKNEDEYKIRPVLFVAGNFLLLWLGSCEIGSYFENTGATLNTLRDLSQARGMALSVFWTLYSVILMVYGIFRKYNVARISSIVLFGVTIFKVFFFDLSTLETLYRIISFIVLGLILIATAFLYSRFKDKITEFAIRGKDE